MGYDPAWDAAKARRDHERETAKLFDDEESSTPTKREVPLIDQVHRLIYLWKAGDVNKVDGYRDARSLRRSQLFLHVLQTLIELAGRGNEERSLIESISNHLRASGMAPVSLFDGQGQRPDDEVVQVMPGCGLRAGRTAIRMRHGLPKLPWQENLG